MHRGGHPVSMQPCTEGGTLYQCNLCIDKRKYNKIVNIEARDQPCGETLKKKKKIFKISVSWRGVFFAFLCVVFVV